MRRAEITMGWLVQIVIAGVLLAMLYAFATQTLTGERFKQDVYAADAALLAETLGSTTAGRTQAQTFFEDSTYSLFVNDERAEVRKRGSKLGPSRRYLLPDGVTTPEALVQRQAVQWARFGDTVRVSALNVDFSCPELAQPRAWEQAGATGSHGFIAKRILETAYGDRGLDANDIRVGEQAAQGLTLRLEQADTLSVSTGTGDFASRVRCLAATHLPDAQLTRHESNNDYLAVTAPDPEQISEQLAALLGEVVE